MRFRRKRKIDHLDLGDPDALSAILNAVSSAREAGRRDAEATVAAATKALQEATAQREKWQTLAFEMLGEKHGVEARLYRANADRALLAGAGLVPGMTAAEHHEGEMT